MLAKIKEKLASQSRELIKLVKVSDEVQEIRMSICRQCDQFYAPLKTCNKCGCYMLAKTYIPSSKCPLNKWGPEGE